MRIIVTEEQYSLLTEQSNVYTDKALYNKALKIYNKKMEVYHLFLQLYKERDAWSKYFGADKITWDSPNTKKIRKLMNLDDWNYQLVPVLIFDIYYRCINNLFKNLRGYSPTWDLEKRELCDFYERFYKKLIGNLKVTKWENIKLTSRDSYTKDAWIPIFEKPNIEKPIYRAPESVVNYKELKSETTFAPQYKTGTPVVQVGTYYMTYPEFETYKKSRPNTTFKKI